jgi:hypothetical protein
MIITDQFVFIHLHKTGGQTLNEIITSCMPNHRVVGYHYPRSMVPVNCTALPVVGMVRNPWAWYVSWYCFNRRSTIHNTLFKVVSGRGCCGSLRHFPEVTLDVVGEMIPI